MGVVYIIYIYNSSFGNKRFIFRGSPNFQAFLGQGLHAEFACLIYSMLQHRLPDDVVHAIIRGAVDAERKFICSSARLQSKNGERWVTKMTSENIGTHVVDLLSIKGMLLKSFDSFGKFTDAMWLAIPKRHLWDFTQHFSTLRWSFTVQFAGNELSPSAPRWKTTRIQTSPYALVVLNGTLAWHLEWQPWWHAR